MTIKDYYYKLGNISLNISLYFILFAIIIAAVQFYMTMPVFPVFFLMGLSLVYYVIHLYYLKKSYQIFLSTDKNRPAADIDLYVIEYNDSSIYFFSPDGRVKVELKTRFAINGIKFFCFENNRMKRQFLFRRKKGMIHF